MTTARRNTGKLSHLNRMVDCRSCGKRTHSDVDGCMGLDLCRPCYEYAGWENQHSDENHAANPHAACPVCKGEPDPATLTAPTTPFQQSLGLTPTPTKETPVTQPTPAPTATPTEETPAMTTETTETTATVTPITKAKAPKAPKAPKAAKPVAPTLGVTFENGGEVLRLNVADVALNASENLTRPEGIDADAVAALAEKIATNGQETPVWVRRDGEGKYRVAAGFHRRAAIGLLVEQGRSDGTIEAKVLVDASTLGASVANVTENENGKRDITPLGRVTGYSALIEQGLTVAQVAALTGRAEDFVRDHLRLPKGAPECSEVLRLPEDDAAFIPWGVVRLVLRWPKGQQADLLKQVRGLSVAKAAAKLKALRDAEQADEEPEADEGEGEGEGTSEKADPAGKLALEVALRMLPLFDLLVETVRQLDSALGTNDVETAEGLVVTQRKAVDAGQDALLALVGSDVWNAAQAKVDALRSAADGE